MGYCFEVDVLAQEKAEGYRAMPAHLPHATPMYHHKVDPEAAPSEEMRCVRKR